MERFVCIHGHFYQPPRENPWLGEIELQDSAYPYHDWNERITAECYAPNAVARILDGEGKIVDLANNYTRISFNFGPTLLSWMEQKHPDVYRLILEGDRESRRRYSGHGSAIAQVYNHMIMPLANRADKVTQVVWGVRDFEHRFGRRPEGMWLPETAVDLETLDVLAEHGIRFTILSPHQAAAVRGRGEKEWRDVSGGRIDTRVPYRQELPSGRSIAVFFYNDPISRAVAFERLLTRGENLAERLWGAFEEGRAGPQLVHIATDGESYGHHHPHGDMALAYALHHIEDRGRARLTNYGEFLDLCPPEREVRIRERTAWSCPHGLGRWERDCGCGTGRGWHQRWRAPLRAALDWLRDAAAGPFERRGAELLRDPWAARDDYVACLLDPSEERRERFVSDHAARELDPAERAAALKLMELQQNLMFMYTSCGWFFDEISGIEAVQVLMYAGRAIHLAEELFGLDLEPQFLELLEKAPSNLKEYGNGRRVYEKWVRPARVGWEKIAAHYAVSSLFESYEDRTEMFGHRVERRDYNTFEAGRVRMVLGRAELTSLRSGEAVAFLFGALHFGDHNVNCSVCPDRDGELYAALTSQVAAAFARVDYAEIIRMLDRDLGGTSYSLGSLFRDEQRRVLKRVLREILTETEEAYARIYQQHLPLMRFLSHLGVPLPRAYQTAAEFVFNNGLREAYTAEPPDFARARALAAEAGEWDVPLDRADHAYRLARVLSRLARRWEEAPADLELLGALRDGVEAALALPFEVDLWDVQNRYFGLLRSFFPRFEAVAAEGPPGSLAWLGQFVSLGEMLGIEVSAMKETLAELGRAPLVADLVREFTLRRHVPRATYRLQFHKDFPFSEAEALAGYLAGLGVSDCYASPVLCSRPGSPHGYDIIDHARIAPDLGGEEGFYSLADALHREGLCLILDTVPNHMGIDHPDNRWWMDVLENGPSARHAGYFDIDWDPVNPDLTNKVLLPVLGDQYGAELEAGRFRLHYDDGAFRLTYYDHVFPIAPGTNALILEKALEGVVRALGPGHEDAVELESILTALQYLPPRTGLTPEKIAERYREKEVIRRRVRDLVNRSPAVREAVGRSVALFNGRPGDPASFDLLDRLIDGQPYRPAFWRVAMEEINYRRFFDINDLAAIRVERPEVFRATHELFLGLIGEGRADGLRIDHPDGLWNPTHYFRDLQLGALVAKLMRRLPPQREAAQVRQEAAEALEALRREAGDGPPPRPLYVVAEKILSEGEQLPEHWAVDGTTGYDFLNLLNGLFVAGRNEEAFDVIYREFAGPPPDFRQLVNSTKKMIMLISMASEINSLSHQLDRIAERNRQYRDFTLNSLTFALREVVACLPVYRTYITSPEDVTLRDRLLVENTIEEAKQRNPRTFESVFDFIGDTLLLRNLDRFPEGDRPMLIDWVMRFQQVTGPVMAKGVEDTAFYIYNRLVSLNEVGGHPVHFGVSLEAFHEQTAERLRRWPHSMLASSTHDTKRSEDVRARLNVLSEIPEEWREALFSWSQINAPRLTTLDDQLAPAANDQYLLYQTLVGAWPPGEMTREEFAEFRRRISDYMLKAVKEAKARTSWVNPVEEYDQAVADFVAKLLPDEREGDAFLTHFLPFQKRVAFFGYFNSLAQVLLKVASPGVPDFYQGTELWDFSLVDPDNRRPVDYARRRKLLEEFRERTRPADLRPLCRELLASLPDGRIKFFVTYQALQLRAHREEVFREGSYVPLFAAESHRQHVCAFAREVEGAGVIAAAPRLVATLTGGQEQVPVGPEVWKDGRLELPPEYAGRSYRNVFTGETLAVRGGPESASLPLAELFQSFPVALLEYAPAPQG